MQAGSTYAAVVGAVIAQVRSEVGMSQAQLAEQVGIGQPAWSRIEKGGSVLSVDQLARAARAMKTAPHRILELADKTVEQMRVESFEVSYDKPQRNEPPSDNTGLLLLGGAALAALIYAASKK
ncbi:helix-turn-helix domain-containing protein [Mangrovitalea sediminis]|uniref:helix-turn-helix domain-containing protein n=1 Tax=Mangrovitalea sediminis TaxID=1982043 RepID=UPI0013041C19|nr:helix-turn-helix transcriptional regulator [Mangrovitalea sediminis]